MFNPFKPKPQLLFIAKEQTENWAQEFIGKVLEIEGKPIKVKKIVGSKIKPTFFEVNGKHLIGCLRAYAQIYNDDSITEEEFKLHETIEYEVKSPNEQKKLAMELDKNENNNH